jgi:ATP-dependent DNA ligase
MNDEILLIRKNSKGKPQFLKMVLSGDTLSREWGLVEGKTQHTSNTCKPVNVGKANEKSAEQVAQEEFTKLKNKKIKEGYLETDSLDDLSVLDQEIVIGLNAIPESFCVSKPKQRITKTLLDKLAKSDKGKFFIKYNGLFHYILINSDKEVRIYTRRWFDHTVKYPEIVKDIKACGLPANTLMGFEFCIDPKLKLHHMTAFSLMSSISKTDTREGACLEDQSACLALQEKHRVRAAAICFLYCANDPAWYYPYSVILNSLQRTVPKMAENRAIFVPTEVPIESGTQALDLIRTNKDKIEGFVVWDTEQCMQVTMNGKPNRAAAWKVKAEAETDVIALDWEEGKGKHQGRVGSLRIGLYDEFGEIKNLGTVGGLPDELREPNLWNFPCVIEIKYDQVFPDTGRFQFPRFSKIHEDKTPEETNTFKL